MIHAASRQALVEVRRHLDGVLEGRSGVRGANQTLSDELASVSGLLVTQPRLRRTLADPATNASSRADLVRSLLAGKIDDEALDVVADAVSQRWSSAWDLTDAIEILSDDVLLAQADKEGQLDDVEDELFRFERILADASDLVAAFDDLSVPVERRLDLLNTVLAAKVNPITLALLTHVITSARKPNLELSLDDLLEASAARRDRSVARVISATALTDEQAARLGTALTEMYGREITIRSAIDPSVQGGLSVRVGDEFIDGTIASRMAAARSALAH
jgi:F-type H+-transporting ATPase subunit delta